MKLKVKLLKLNSAFGALLLIAFRDFKEDIFISSHHGCLVRSRGAILIQR